VLISYGFFRDFLVSLHRQLEVLWKLNSAD